MIHLLKDYYMDNDSRQFILKKAVIVKDEKSKNFGELNYVSIAYCPKFEQLLKQAHRLKLLEGDYSTLEQLTMDSKAISDTLINRALVLTQKGD